jgi:hypothetical protein
LAQYAATGCLNATFYASAEEQLQTILNLCQLPEVEPEYIARLALYARTQGHMKDVPALLCAVLSIRGPGLMAEVFDRVIDDGRMLRNFVQIMRSGTVDPRRFALSSPSNPFERLAIRIRPLSIMNRGSTLRRTWPRTCRKGGDMTSCPTLF